MSDDESLVHFKESTQRVQPLWFYLPNNEDGKKPSKDTPWLRFRFQDGCKLESKLKLISGTSHETEKDQNGSNQPLHGSFTTTHSKSVSKWYELEDTDVPVEHNRHAVCFTNSRSESTIKNPLIMMRKPLLWRFHGDEVRRASWVLDTKHGLQPYCHEAATV